MPGFVTSCAYTTYPLTEGESFEGGEVQVSVAESSCGTALVTVGRPGESDAHGNAASRSEVEGLTSLTVNAALAPFCKLSDGEVVSIVPLPPE